MMLIITALLPFSLHRISSRHAGETDGVLLQHVNPRYIQNMHTCGRVFFLLFHTFRSWIGILNFGRPLILTRVNAFPHSLSLKKHRIDLANARVPRVLRRVRRRRYREAVLANTRRPERRLGTNLYSFPHVSLCCFFSFAVRSMCRSVGFRFSLSLLFSPR